MNTAGSSDSREAQFPLPEMAHNAPSRETDIWQRRTLWLLTALFAWRVVYLAVLPLDLCPDEAYYWDWSRQLDIGYYSKPPMIAWIIAAATAIGGASEFTIRLPAALLGTIGLWPIFCLGRSLYSSRVGFWTVAAMAATPGLTALNFLMTIDAPFLCAWAFAVWTVWQLFSGPSVNTRWLVPAIMATGLGLLSKQTMFAVFPLTLCWLGVQAEHRPKLLSWPLWTWVGTSLAALTPVVWWNSRHQWITVQHTSEHFQGFDAGFSRHFSWFFEFWGSQFGVLSPITCALLLALTIVLLVRWQSVDDRGRFLLCFGAVPMTGVAVLSFLQRVQPNWPVAFLMTSFVLLAAWGCRELQPAVLQRWSSRWLSAGMAVGALMVAGLYSVPFVVPRSQLAGTSVDATARLRGWKDLGHLLGRHVDADSASRDPLIIAATGRGYVSELAYYAPGRPRVYRWNPTRIVESQHEVWGGPRGDHFGEPAVLVTQSGQDLPVELARAFSTVTPGPLLEVPLGGRRVERLQLWYADEYRGWPSDLPPPADFIAGARIAGQQTKSH